MDDPAVAFVSDEKSPNSFLPGLPRSIINRFRFYDRLQRLYGVEEFPAPRLEFGGVVGVVALVQLVQVGVMVAQYLLVVAAQQEHRYAGALVGGRGPYGSALL